MPWLDPYISLDTTEEEYKKVALHGGRISTKWKECWILDCDEARPHYHTICSHCGCVDLADISCQSCNTMRKVMRIQEDLRQWRKDNWKILLLARILVVVILFTIATWKGVSS